MIENSDLSRLSCGDVDTIVEGRLKEMLSHLQRSIDTLINSLFWLRSESDDRVELFAPFLGRAVLELCVTALIGRLDPFRLLFVREVQSQANYATDKPWSSAIRWQGDVLASKVADLWGPKAAYGSATKALLGDYYDHLVWRPAFRTLTNNWQSGSQWLAELQKHDADSFIARQRTELERHYSTLSKGVHHEFILPRITSYDRATITATINKMVQMIANLSLVSHFADCTALRLAPEDAISTFNRVEDLEII